jgi:CysZ protein
VRVRDFFRGMGLLGSGFSYWARRPKVMLLGAIPAVLATALITAALMLLAFHIDDLAGWLTGFAADWNETWRTAVQVVAGVMVFALALWLSVVVFTALTLLIGDPFYEAIANQVEKELGGAPDDSQGFWASLGRSVRDALRLVGKSLLASLVLFAIGLIPVVGAFIALVLGAFVGGWFLAVEMSAYAFNRRGLRYRDYRKLLARRRALALGFGTPVFLLFMIPLGAIVVMPAAVVAGTLAARQVYTEASVTAPHGAPPRR